MSKPFGFTVEPESIWKYAGGDNLSEVGSGWRVKLPHQCDSWDIAGESMAGVPLAEAVAELERFIAEAQVALAELRRKAAST